MTSCSRGTKAAIIIITMIINPIIMIVMMIIKTVIMVMITRTTYMRIYSFPNCHNKYTNFLSFLSLAINIIPILIKLKKPILLLLKFQITVPVKASKNCIKL